MKRSPIRDTAAATGLAAASSKAARRRARFAAALAGLSTAVAVLAAGGGIDEPAERARIDSERAAANSGFLERERECRKRFVVTSCVNDARRDQRETLARLRSEEAVLDDAQRKQRAAQRMETIREKLDKGDAKDREAGSTEQREAHRQATEPRVKMRSNGREASEPRRAAPSPRSRSGAGTAAVSTSSSGGAASAATPAASAESRRAQEARNRAAFDSRNEAAQAHREMVAKRNAERALKRKPVAPLPTPAASTP
ncbi:hypothetical protein BH11PSE8_BH11PSE8_25120 [soil metagenome]